MTILYLHGFGSDGTSPKGQLLKTNFPDFKIITPSLSEHPSEAIKQIFNILSTEKQLIIIGTSLGGFYADYINKVADVPALLINPMTNVPNFKKRIGHHKNYNTNQPFEFTLEDFNHLEYLDNKKNDFYTDSPEYVLLAKDDEVIDYSVALNQFTEKNNKVFVSDKGGHRFTENNLIIDTIRNLLNLIEDYDFYGIHNESFESFIYSKSLNEHYLNLFNKPDKLKLWDEIKPLIEESYNYVGGYAGSIDSFFKNGVMWKLVRKNNKIVAGAIYKDKLGRKGVCAFTDGTPLGKSELSNIVIEDIKLNRAWREVSGKAESIYLHKFKATPLPHSIIKPIMKSLNKEVLDWDEDGIHYTRLIQGNLITKCMFGNVEL